MELLLQFIEKYWGFTLLGGTTVGTLITFAVMQIKAFKKDGMKSATIQALFNKVEELTEKNNAVMVQNQELVKLNESAVQRTQTQDKAMALTFKAISFLVVSSKLNNEDKLALQADFIKLTEEIKEEGLTAGKNAVQRVVETVPETREEVQTIITSALSTATTLLDKYMGAK